jgi:hypothetical protein
MKEKIEEVREMGAPSFYLTGYYTIPVLLLDTIKSNHLTQGRYGPT